MALYATPMLTVPEVAARLGKSPETIRRWIRSGRLRARKIGTQHTIDEADLVAFTTDEVTMVPAGWAETATGEPMPDIVTAVRRSRLGR